MVKFVAKVIRRVLFGRPEPAQGETYRQEGESVKTTGGLIGWLRGHRAAAAVFVLVFWALSSVISVRHERESAKLRAAYEESAEKIKTLEAERARLETELAAYIKALDDSRNAHDKAIKEAGANAYIKALDIADSDMLDAFNALIDGARSRNTERGRANPGPAE